MAGIFQFISGYFLVVIILAVFFLMSAIKILNEYERGVIFRLGRALHFAKGQDLLPRPPPPGPDPLEERLRPDGAGRPSGRTGEGQRPAGRNPGRADRALG